MTARAQSPSQLWLPIWAKLLLGFAVAVLLPLILMIIAVQPSLREIGLQNLRSYISENGERQRQVVSGVLQQAGASLDSFLSDPANSRRLTNLLMRDSPLIASAQVERTTPIEINELFSTDALNRSTTLFGSIRLLDRNGRLLSQATSGETGVAVTAIDQSRSAAYRAAVNEQMKEGGREQVISVSEINDNPVIEITSILRWRDGSAIGYVIAQLDNARALYNTLLFSDASYPAYSFMVTSGGVFISPEMTRDAALLAANSPAVRRAGAGEIGVDVYPLSAGGEEVIGYFAPIPDTPLLLISEVPTSAAATSAVSFFDTRLLVILLVCTALVAALVVVFRQFISVPVIRLRRAAEGMSAGSFDEPVQGAAWGDEIGQLAAAFSGMREQARSLIADLEARIAAYARDIKATQEISRYAATQRDAQTLMDKVVNLIVERFEAIYHAQIFLLDADRHYALLRASTGEVGQTLIGRGHRLSVGSVSVIGQVTEHGRVVVARDTAASQVHRRNEFLPDTRAELAIPLRVGDQVIGALDVQSKQRDAFTDDLINVLQTMADQIAIAIQNARLYEESLRRLQEIERSNRAATLRVWQEFMRGQRARALASEAGSGAGSEIASLREAALASGQLRVGDVTERQTVPVAVPVILRGQILGAVEWEIPARDFDQNRLQLAQELANRLAVSLDNARLFEDSQRATERERIVNSIAARLTSQTDIQEILQTAVREVGQALRAPQVSIQLRRTDADDSGKGNGGSGHHDDEQPPE